MPRLGSRVRIPSPAPFKIKDLAINFAPLRVLFRYRDSTGTARAKISALFSSEGRRRTNPWMRRQRLLATPDPAPWGGSTPRRRRRMHPTPPKIPNFYVPAKNCGYIRPEIPRYQELYRFHAVVGPKPGSFRLGSCNRWCVPGPAQKSVAATMPSYISSFRLIFMSLAGARSSCRRSRSGRACIRSPSTLPSVKRRGPCSTSPGRSCRRETRHPP